MSEQIKAMAASFADYRTNVGFWLYLMTDCILFGVLFATYVVLEPGIAGGPSGDEIFQMPLVLAETFILLTSSFTCGLALIALKQGNIKQLLAWLTVTYILGVSFLTIELTEFATLVGEGHGWTASAFLSAFFALVGTHGLHITVGLLWLLVLVAVIATRGLSAKTTRQLGLFALFWHFLDLVWIFIFTIVYLMGVLS